MWDKKLHLCMKKAGFKSLEGQPGFFYNKSLGVECTVYVDDFVLVAPPALEAKVWKALSDLIDFKDPAEPVTRYLGIYHEFSYSKDNKITFLKREGTKYLTAVVQRYLEEIGAKTLPWVGSPTLDDCFDEAALADGKQKATAASHLMSILYVARLCRADLVTSCSFLARRVSAWTVNEDRRLKRLMSFIFSHLDLCLEHCLSTDDLATAVLCYYADAELGGDTMTTKATGGYWLELQSACGQKRWPISWATKKAAHTSTNTADSEIWSLVGAYELGLRKEVIPILQQIEVSLNRHVLLRGLEDNTACIAAIKRGYSSAMRHLQRHCRLSLGFSNEVFFPDKTDPDAPFYLSELVYCPTDVQKGDWMTKELTPVKFAAALQLAGYNPRGA